MKRAGFSPVNSLLTVDRRSEDELGLEAELLGLRTRTRVRGLVLDLPEVGLDFEGVAVQVAVQRSADLLAVVVVDEVGRIDLGVATSQNPAPDTMAGPLKA